MEKRFVLFIVLTTAILFGHAFFRAWYLARHPAAAPDGPQGVAADADAAAAPDADRPAADKEKPPAKPEVPEAPNGADPPPARPPVAEAVQETPAEWVSLGSYLGDRASPYLITFSSRGGSIERIELTERNAKGKLRYLNLESKAGYLGHLAATADPAGGVRVNVVGESTPADAAVPSNRSWEPGLRVGDRLVAATPARGARTLVADREDLHALLARTRPNETLELEVVRRQGDREVTGSFTVTLGVRPFQLIQPEPQAPGDERLQPYSCLMSLYKIGARETPNEDPELPALRSQRNSHWRTVRQQDGTVEFRLRLGPEQLDDLGLEGDLELVKRYRLSTDDAPDTHAAYHLDMEVELINHGQQPQEVGYRLDGPNGLPLEGWWYSHKIHPRMFYSAGARDVVFQTRGTSHVLIGCSAIYKEATKSPEDPLTTLFAQGTHHELQRTVLYIGVDTQYFLSAFVPLQEDGTAGVEFARAEAFALGDLEAKKKALMRTTNVSFFLKSRTIELAPGVPYQQRFRLFAGPKEPEALATHGLQDSIYYGWFGGVARPLSHVLHFFHNLVGNYGLAILLLTVLVRGCMFPISRKAAKNAAMMQELAPEMKKITEKYKNDMEKRAKAQQELFRKHNYNPLGGCWLMFLQLPIFIGLYRCLSVDIELRQAPLIPGLDWCSNLAGPDMLFYWENSFLGLFTETGILGPYFNLLPLITIALFLLQQQLFTPPATDETTRMQMRMMKFMSLFIGILFFKVAAGLCIYFIASSAWSIAERVLLPKPKLKTGEAAAAPAARPTPRRAEKPGANGATKKSANKSRKRTKRR